MGASCALVVALVATRTRRAHRGHAEVSGVLAGPWSESGRPKTQGVDARRRQGAALRLRLSAAPAPAAAPVGWARPGLPAPRPRAPNAAADRPCGRNASTERMRRRAAIAAGAAGRNTRRCSTRSPAAADHAADSAPAPALSAHAVAPRGKHDYSVLFKVSFPNNYAPSNSSRCRRGCCCGVSRRPTRGSTRRPHHQDRPMVRRAAASATKMSCALDTTRRR